MFSITFIKGPYGSNWTSDKSNKQRYLDDAFISVFVNGERKRELTAWSGQSLSASSSNDLFHSGVIYRHNGTITGALDLNKGDLVQTKAKTDWSSSIDNVIGLEAYYFSGVSLN